MESVGSESRFRRCPGEAHRQRSSRLDREMVLWTRVYVATEIGRYDRASDAAKDIILRFGEPSEPDKRASLTMTTAIACVKEDQLETGLVMLRDLTGQEGLGAHTRGWLWRNLSLALPPKEEGDACRIDFRRRFP